MAALMANGTWRAPLGQSFTQRMQEMQVFLSVRRGLMKSMAPAGQFAAQTPQRTQRSEAEGFTGTPS